MLQRRALPVLLLVLLPAMLLVLVHTLLCRCGICCLLVFIASLRVWLVHFVQRALLVAAPLLVLLTCCTSFAWTAARAARLPVYHV